MPFSLVSTILLWTLVLWALGWLVLPVARRLFTGLPDGGLSAGRVLFIVLVALFCFWGATLRAVPLTLAPAVAAVAAIAGAAGWRDASARAWARENWRALLFSDAIFLLSWAAFTWIRLQHPEINDLEKPMDAALLSAAWKTDWLPFAHPWWGGAGFTNYYYFGPFTGALMARALNTAPQFAYNLVQPAFCAFFLSTIWSLGAALARSRWWGVGVVILVGACGPLEPLRQWSEKGWMWPFDWFSTSRVIPNTINEYPAFTLAIGDAHAHFYALSFAALWLCLAWSLFAQTDTHAEFASASRSGAAEISSLEKRVNSASFQRRSILIMGGLVLGAWLMTNTWDAPIFGLLFGAAIWLTRAPEQSNIRALAAVVAPFVIAIGAAALYLRNFHAPLVAATIQIGPLRLPNIVAWFPWRPNSLDFALLWGGWIVVGALAFALPATPARTPNEASARFRRLLLGAGLLALALPFFFYIRDAFDGGELRHQNTIFKFGLQAWLLLGLGLSAELGARCLTLPKKPQFAVACALLLALPALLLAPASTIWARAISLGTAQSQGASLDGARYLPLAQQQAIAWLQRNGRAGEIVMEGVSLGQDGSPVGDYDARYGRVGAFSGLSSTLGWPQHVWGWDGNYGEVVARGQQIAALYRLPSIAATAQGAAALGARYTFFGNFPDPAANVEGAWQTPSPAETETLRAAGFAVHSFAGADGSSALIVERIGR